MQKTSPNQLLASTAAWTAGMRAKESEREDRLFYDPWRKRWPARMVWPGSHRAPLKVYSQL